MCHGRLPTAAIDFRKRKNAIHVRTAPHRTTSKQYYMQLNLACIRKFMIWCLWSWAPSLASVRSEFLLLLLESQLLIAGCLRNFRAKRTFSILPCDLRTLVATSCHCAKSVQETSEICENISLKMASLCKCDTGTNANIQTTPWMLPRDYAHGLLHKNWVDNVPRRLQHVWEMQKQWKIHVVFEMPTKWHESKWNQ